MQLVSSGTDLKLHTCPDYKQTHVYRPADSSGQIRNLSWCKDGTWLAVVPNQGNTEIIRTKDDVRLLQSILSVTQPTAAVFQRTTKRSIAISAVNGSVLIYDIKIKSIKKRFASSGSTVTMLDWNLKDTHLAAGSTDGCITLFSNSTNQKSTVFTVPNSKSVSVVRFHSTLRHVLGTASDEGVVVVWDINNGKQKLLMKSHNAPVTDLAFSPHNSNFMVSVALDRTFQCYDSNAAEVALSVMTDHPLSAVDMAPDGYVIAAGSSRGTIYIYDLRSHQKPLKIIPAHSGEIKNIFYQPLCMDSTESFIVPEEKSSEINIEKKSSNVSVDSFLNAIGYISDVSPRNNEKQEVKQRTCSAAGDSFLCDLEKSELLTKKDNLELSNLGLSDSVKKWLDAKKSEPNHSLDKGKQSEINQIPNVTLSSSTPKQIDRIDNIQQQDILKTNVSPILHPIPIENQEYFKEIVRNIVTEVVTNVVTEKLSDFEDALNRYFLNLQLSFSKQFIGQENHIERLFDYYNNSNLKSNSAIQMQQLQLENEFLKKKINEMLKQNQS